MIIACIAGFALVFQACSQNEDIVSPSNDSYMMRFSTHYPGQTRVADNVFEQGDTIGLYVAGDTLPLEPGGNTVNNEMLTCNGNVWTPTRTLYWDDGTYTAYAYYPYQKTMRSVDDMPVTVCLDQSTASTATAMGGYEASDLLWARTKGIHASADPVPLVFSHVMSKLTIRLIKGEDYEGDLPSDAEVYVHNTVPTATFDLAAGVVTKAPKGSRASIRAHQDAATLFSAIVVPQRLPNSVPLVEVVAKGVSYLYESRFVFKPGVNHLVNLILSDNPEQVKINIGGEVEGWNE